MPRVSIGGITNNAALVYNVAASQTAKLSHQRHRHADQGRHRQADALGKRSATTGKTFLTGGTLALSTPPAEGLWEGLVSNNNGADTTDPIPHDLDSAGGALGHCYRRARQQHLSHGPWWDGLRRQHHLGLQRLP